MNKILCCICILAGPFLSLVGQEAKIMILDKADSDKLSRAYADYKGAQIRWDAVKSHVSAQYVNSIVNGKPLPGWEKVQFSADFRAIVPIESQYANHGITCSGYTWGYPPSAVLTNSSGTPSLMSVPGTAPLDPDVLPLTIKEKQ